jgi:predicted membrane metal-binding protein
MKFLTYLSYIFLLAIVVCAALEDFRDLGSKKLNDLKCKCKKNNWTLYVLITYSLVVFGYVILHNIQYAILHKVIM